MQLVCPAGSLPALKSALRQGADAIYVGFRDDTNARHFAGLNLDERQLQEGLRRVHEAGRQLYVAVNTYSSAQGWERWQRAVDQAADLGVDALIAADVAVLGYAAKRHPRLNLHLSVQGSATNAAALALYHERYGIRRAVLPACYRWRRYARWRPVARCRWRCSPSAACASWPRAAATCPPTSPASRRTSAASVRRPGRCAGARNRRVDLAPQRSAHRPLRRRRGSRLPTLCKGRFLVNGQRFHALEEPTSLNTLDLVRSWRKSAWRR